MLKLRARVDVGAMAMKGFSAFFKAPALLFNVISRTFVREFYPSAKIQSVYSTAPGDWLKVDTTLNNNQS